jgi:predicted DNA binding CopG/RHH family protein
MVYKNAPKDVSLAISESVRVGDFLPAPGKLVFKEKMVKVTLNLSKDSIDFFKREAKETGVPYQKMIKNLIDLYTHKYQKS